MVYSHATLEFARVNYKLDERANCHVCSDSAKPSGNMALRVLQPFYFELCEALSSDPHQMALEMYSRALISRDEKSMVVECQAALVTRVQRAEILVRAVEGKLVAENNWKDLTIFFQLLEKRPTLRNIAARMKAKLSKLSIVQSP